MDAIAQLKHDAAAATEKLSPYRVREAREGGVRVLKVCPTGESLMGRFTTRDAAEAWLLTRLPAPARTPADA